jgi:hypothetical protein
MAPKRYALVAAVDLVSEDEQLAANFAQLWVQACNQAAQILSENEAFEGKLEVVEHEVPE